MAGLSDCSQRIDTLHKEVMGSDKSADRSLEGLRRRGDSVHAIRESGSRSDDGSEDNFGEFEAHLNQEPLPAMVQAAGQMPGSAPVSSAPSFCPVDSRDILDMESVSPAMQESLATTMYPREVSRRLIEVYLDTINLYRHPIPSNLVWEAFDKFYGKGGVVDAEHITQFGLLAAICSIATLYVAVSRPELIPELSKNGAYDELEASKHLCNASQIACFTAQNMCKEDIYTVLTFTLLSRLHFVRGRIELAWNATVNSVRVAFALGIHRDGESLGLDPETTERRRIVWSLVYPMERINSLGFGRPMIISDAFCDTRPPQLSASEVEVPEPLRPLFANVRPPNVLLINNLRSRLAYFIGDLAFEVQNVNKVVSYSRILQIHVAFNHFVMDELPFYFRIRLGNDELVQNTHCDNFYPHIKVQRYQLWLDFNFFILSLHCPYLVRYNARSREKYETSYEACLEAVKLNLALRRELLYDDSLPQRYRDSMAGFRWFNTVVVAGFILLKGPTQSDAALLTQYMNEFMEWRANHRGMQRNQDLNREIDIVRAFLEQSKLSADDSHGDPSETPTSTSSDGVHPKRQRLSATENRGPFSVSSLVSDAPPTTSQPMTEFAGVDVNAWRQPSHFLMPGSDASTANELPWSQPGESARNSMSGTAGAPPNMLNSMGVGGASHIPYTSPLIPNAAGGATNLNNMYGMPMITPNVGLNPQTLMPVWPMNAAGTMPAANNMPNDVQRSQDTQQLLDLW